MTMGLSDDELELALAATDAADAWVTRLVCRAFRDRCERRAATRTSAVQSVERLELALELGADRTLVGRAAARAGKLEVLEWARDHGCKWNHAWMCSEAARGGHLKVLQWLRANGCVWDIHTCREAQRGGHLEVLDWARAHGCEAEHRRNQRDSLWLSPF